jgi:hypothetical protein
MDSETEKNLQVRIKQLEKEIARIKNKSAEKQQEAP